MAQIRVDRFKSDDKIERDRRRERKKKEKVRKVIV